MTSSDDIRMLARMQIWKREIVKSRTGDKRVKVGQCSGEEKGDETGNDNHRYWL